MGKIKAMVDSSGSRVTSAGPSTAVRIVGLSGLPQGRTDLLTCKDEAEATAVVEGRRMAAEEDSTVSVCVDCDDYT